MYRSPADRKAEAARLQQLTEDAQQYTQRPQQRTGQGHYSNDRIVKRNGGVPPQFLNSVGGCSANYR